MQKGDGQRQSEANMTRARGRLVANALGPAKKDATGPRTSRAYIHEHARRRRRRWRCAMMGEL